MNPKQLEYLEAIAEYRNINKAARALGVSQSTVSTALIKLEQELHVPVLTHRNGIASLSEYGQILLRYKKVAYQALDNALSAIEDKKETGLSNVRFIDRTPLGNYTGILAEFQRAHPSISLTHVTPTESESFLNYDLEFFASSQIQNKDQVRYICDENYVVLISNKHRLASHSFIELSSLKREPLIFSSSPSEMNTVINGMFRQARFVPREKIALPVFWDIMHMVDQGFGYCIATDITWLCNNKLNIKALPIKDTKRSRSLYLKSPLGLYVSRSTRTFADYLCEKLIEWRHQQDEQYTHSRCRE